MRKTSWLKSRLMKSRLVLLLLSVGLLLVACQVDMNPGKDDGGQKGRPSQPPKSANEEGPTPVPAETNQPVTPSPEETTPPGGELEETVTPTEAAETEPAAEILTPTPPEDPWSAYPPAPEDSWMDRGAFFAEEVTLLPVARQPGQVKLWVQGYLPTPCNLPRAHVNPPDAQNTIHVELYSVMPRDKMCAEVIKPFAGLVATLGELPSGTYQVVVDEDLQAGTFTVP